MKFKEGDKVRRIGCEWKGIKVGHIYTVTKCGSNYINIKGYDLQPSPDKFVLASPILEKLMEVLDD